MSFQLKGMDCETVASKLSDQGFAVRAGLHCAPEAHRTAGTVSDGTIRMSVSSFNTEREIRQFAGAVASIAKKRT